MGKFRDRLIAEGSFNHEWDFKDVNQHTEYMQRETIIRISRRGSEGMWHNTYIGQEFYGVIGESETEFQIGDTGLWIDKHFVDVKHSENESWVSGDKYRSARKEEATRPKAEKMKYRKKPVEIEAVHFADATLGTLDKISEFMNQEQQIVFNDSVAEPKIKIETLEGPMFASLGDYIIKGIKGEFYACKPDIFELTYDKVN